MTSCPSSGPPQPLDSTPSKIVTSTWCCSSGCHVLESFTTRLPAPAAFHRSRWTAPPQYWLVQLARLQRTPLTPPTGKGHSMTSCPSSGLLQPRDSAALILAHPVDADATNAAYWKMSQHDFLPQLRPAAAAGQRRLDGPLVEAAVVCCHRHHAQFPQPHERGGLQQCASTTVGSTLAIHQWVLQSGSLIKGVGDAACQT